MEFKRIFLLVLDSAGIGATKASVGQVEESPNTLLHVLENTDLEYPNFSYLGLQNLIYNTQNPVGDYYTIAEPKSEAKDSLSGYLEMMGVINTPGKIFTECCPNEMISAISDAVGRDIIGNKKETSLDIINQLGEQHIKSGDLILYTSDDSTIHIAAHESIIPIKELYRLCQIIRSMTEEGNWKVENIIAQPFIGKPGAFELTTNHREFKIPIDNKNVLDSLKEKGYHVLAVGKIGELFNQQGISISTKTINNEESIQKILIAIHKTFTGLCFVNLNDFDSEYGHKRDVKGYAEALKEIDNALPQIIADLTEQDLLIITADYGNDPTFTGHEYTKENVPVFIFSKQFSKTGKIENLSTLADIGATIAENFEIDLPVIGTSILDKLQ